MLSEADVVFESLCVSVRLSICLFVLAKTEKTTDHKLMQLGEL